ncbi:MAG: ADP-ribosylglycohydrolase family protein [Candidatus Neomarinimicrobiota bacterium]
MVIANLAQLRDRIAGALYGLAVGDALGSITEGMNPSDIAAKYGMITGFQSGEQMASDDTEFTIFYIELLRKYGLGITAETIADRWLKDIYHPSEIYKGAGFSEAMTLRNLKRGIRPPFSGQHVHSWSDGLAMCATPFGCIFAGQPEKAARIASVFGSVSHSGEGLYGGQAVAAAVSVAVAGADLNTINNTALAHVPEDSWVHYSIAAAVEIGKSSPNVQAAVASLYEKLVCDYYYWSDLAPEAVGLAFGLLTAAGGDFRKAVLGAVNLGRDADTIAAITGAISGAKIGLKFLPPELLPNVETIPGRCIRAMAGKKISDAVEVLGDLAEKGMSAHGN